MHGPSKDDLLALANLVREAARPAPVPEAAEGMRETGRRGHLPGAAGSDCVRVRPGCRSALEREV